jgi:hypothetical protein
MDCNPVAASQFITGMAAGLQLQVDHLPDCLLPHAVLLSTIGLRTYQQQIVDDYAYLLQRMQDVWAEPDFTHRRFWHPQLAHCWFILVNGPRGEYHLDEIQELGYAFQLYEELVNADTDQLFIPTDGKAVSQPTGAPQPVKAARHQQAMAATPSRQTRSADSRQRSIARRQWQKRR